MPHRSNFNTLTFKIRLIGSIKCNKLYNVSKHSNWWWYDIILIGWATLYHIHYFSYFCISLGNPRFDDFTFTSEFYRGFGDYSRNFHGFGVSTNMFVLSRTCPPPRGGAGWHLVHSKYLWNALQRMFRKILVSILR